MSKWKVREFRNNLAKALDEADQGKPVIVERSEAGGGDMRKKAKKIYKVERDNHPRASAKPKKP